MALDRAFGDFLGEEGVGAGKILSDLLNDKNIDTKTHIVSPEIGRASCRERV